MDFHFMNIHEDSRMKGKYYIYYAETNERFHICSLRKNEVNEKGARRVRNLFFAGKSKPTVFTSTPDAIKAFGITRINLMPMQSAFDVTDVKQMSMPEMFYQLGLSYIYPTSTYENDFKELIRFTSLAYKRREWQIKDTQRQIKTKPETAVDLLLIRYPQVTITIEEEDGLIKFKASVGDSYVYGDSYERVIKALADKMIAS